MERKGIMIDMDEVIVKGRFTEFIDEFLGGVDFEKLNGFYRQDLIKGREEEFKKIYAFKNLYKNNDVITNSIHFYSLVSSLHIQNFHNIYLYSYIRNS